MISTLNTAIHHDGLPLALLLALATGIVATAAVIWRGFRK
jgi:hypothetical protein